MINKKLITFGMIFLFVVLVSAGAVLYINANPRVINLNNQTKQVEGIITYTFNKTEHSCFISEDELDVGDVATCIGCQRESNGEIVCPVEITNIKDWNNNVLQEALDNGTYRYKFGETNLGSG